METAANFSPRNQMLVLSHATGSTPSELNLADSLTKALDKPSFFRLLEEHMFRKPEHIATLRREKLDKESKSDKDPPDAVTEVEK